MAMCALERTIVGSTKKPPSSGKALPELGGFFVEPTIVRSSAHIAICAEEIFAPILHVYEVASLEEAIALNNAVPQGLSSSLFTRDLAHAESWLSAAGSDRSEERRVG